MDRELARELSAMRYQLSQLISSLGALSPDQAAQVIHGVVVAVRTLKAEAVQTAGQLGTLQSDGAALQQRLAAGESTSTALAARVSALEATTTALVAWGATVSPPFTPHKN